MERKMRRRTELSRHPDGTITLRIGLNDKPRRIEIDFWSPRLWALCALIGAHARRHPENILNIFPDGFTYHR